MDTIIPFAQLRRLVCEAALISRLPRLLGAGITALALSTTVQAHAPHDPVWALAMSPNYAQDNTLLVGQTGAREWRSMDILLSRDAGSSWFNSADGFDSDSAITSCAASPAGIAPVTYLCTTFGSGVYRSTDSAASWQAANSGLASLDTVAAVIAASDGGFVAWVVDDAGQLFASHDGGDAWQPVPTPIPVSAIAASADYADDRTIVIGSDSGQLAISQDGAAGPGSNWSMLGDIPGVEVKTVVVPAGYALHNTLFAATSGGVQRSEDGGESWQIPGGLPAEYMQAIAASPGYDSDTTVFAATANDGVYKSTDGGDSWTEYATNIPPEPNQSEVHNFILAVSPQFATDQTVLVGTFSGPGLSTDSGESWKILDTRPPSLVMDIAISPDVSSDSSLFISLYTGGGYASDSYGASWRSINQGLGNFSIYDATFTRLEGVDEPVLYAAQQSLVLRSFDLGATWEWLNEDIFPGTRVFPTRFALSPAFASDAIMLMGSRGNGVLRSADGGFNWSQVVPGDGNIITSVEFSPAFADDQTAFIATDGGDVLQSNDGGQSWAALPTTGLPTVAGPYILALSPNFGSDATIFLGTPRGLYRTTNGGGDWNLLGDAILGQGPVETVEVSSDFANDQMVLIALRGKGLYRSVNAGDGWQEIAPDLIANSIQFSEFFFSPDHAVDGTIFGVSGARILRSSDAGDSWQDASLPRVRHEDARRSVALSGDWLPLTSRTHSSATSRVTLQAGTSARLRFTGTGFDWIGAVGPTSGLADVFVDDALVATVDQYNPVYTPATSVYSLEGLAAGVHEVRIVATGDKNPLSGSNVTMVDAIEILLPEDSDLDSVPDELDNCPGVRDTTQLDSDADGFGDACDNCLLQANTLQIDADGDGFGNACDADYNNDGIVNRADAERLRRAMRTFNPRIDLTEDGFVNQADRLRFNELYRKPPGP